MGQITVNLSVFIVQDPSLLELFTRLILLRKHRLLQMYPEKKGRDVLNPQEHMLLRSVL